MRFGVTGAPACRLIIERPEGGRLAERRSHVLRRRFIGTLLMVLGVVGSTLVLAAGTAQAATGTFRDKRGDAIAKADITKIDVRYTRQRVGVRLHLRDFA